MKLKTLKAIRELLNLPSNYKKEKSYETRFFQAVLFVPTGWEGRGAQEAVLFVRYLRGEGQVEEGESGIHFGLAVKIALPWEEAGRKAAIKESLKLK